MSTEKYAVVFNGRIVFVVTSDTEISNMLVHYGYSGRVMDLSTYLNFLKG
jgi:hypothetical protein